VAGFVAWWRAVQVSTPRDILVPCLGVGVREPHRWRTARVGLRLTPAQRHRCFGLLRAAGDVWACAIEINQWRRARHDQPANGYQQLCRLLAESGPGTFGELDSAGARSVLRRYSDAWFSCGRAS
jgi:hypothetical protein